MNRPARYSVPSLLLLALRGYAIGSADLVPGVSGGTVALVSGIYPRLVSAIDAGARSAGRALRGDFTGARRAAGRVDWWFLAPVVVGAALAVVSLARVMEDLLRDHPVRMAAVFFGLIAGSVWVAWRIIREPGALHGAVAGMVGIASFILFGLRSSVVTEPGWYIFVGAGALAICAFILPGVSGSFMLLAIGMYQHVLATINDARLGQLAAFAIGAAVGLGLFSRFLQRLLARHHDLVVAAMIGLMLGSFRILWPWPAGTRRRDRRRRHRPGTARPGPGRAGGIGRRGCPRGGGFQRLDPPPSRLTAGPYGRCFRLAMKVAALT